MRLFVDIENKKLVQGLTTDRSVPTPIFMQGDNEPIELHLLKSGESTLYEDLILDKASDILRIAIARFKGDPKILSFIAEYEPLENGGALIVIPLNTSEIESALGNNQSIDAFLEIEYATTNGRITTILQTPCKVKNDLIENAPSVDVEPTFLAYQVACENAKNGAEEAFKNTSSLLGTKADFSEIIKLTEKQNGAYSGNGFYLNTNNTIRFYPTNNKPLRFTYLFKCTETPSQINLSGGDYDYNYGSNILYINNVNQELCILDSFDEVFYNTKYHTYPLSSKIEAGDKVAVSYDNQTLKVYRKKFNQNLGEMILSQAIPPEFFAGIYLNNIYFGANLFSEFMFIRNCLAYDIYTSYYTIRSYFAGETPPKEMLTKSDLLEYEITQFNSSFSIPNQSTVIVEKNESFDNHTGCLCVYPTAGMGFHSMQIYMSSLFPQMNGKKAYITFEIHYPTTNVNSNLLCFSAARDSTIYPSDSWQTVRYPPYEGGTIYLSFRNTNASNIVGTGSKNDDVAYIRKISVDYSSLDIAIYGTPDSSTLVKNNIIGELAHNGMKYFRKNIESNSIDTVFPKIRDPKFVYDFEISNTNANFNLPYLTTSPNLPNDIFLTSIDLIILANPSSENFTFKFNKSSNTLASETILSPAVGDKYTYQVRKTLPLSDFYNASIVIEKMTSTTSGKVKIQLNFTKS